MCARDADTRGALGAPWPGGTKRATSVTMPLLRLQSSEGKFNVSRNRARTQVLLQARTLHVYGSGTFSAFWFGELSHALQPGRLDRTQTCRLDGLRMARIVARNGAGTGNTPSPPFHLLKG